MPLWSFSHAELREFSLGGTSARIRHRVGHTIPTPPTPIFARGCWRVGALVHALEFLSAPRRRLPGILCGSSSRRECSCVPARKRQLHVLPLSRVGRDL